MFDGLKDIGKLMKQANQMKSEMKKVQDELKKITVSGQALNDKITVQITGDLECAGITIDPSLLIAQNQTQLQKEMQRAVNDAINKAKDLASSKLSAISSGLGLPGA